MSVLQFPETRDNPRSNRYPTPGAYEPSDTAYDREPWMEHETSRGPVDDWRYVACGVVGLIGGLLVGLIVWGLT